MYNLNSVSFCLDSGVHYKESIVQTHRSLQNTAASLISIVSAQRLMPFWKNARVFGLCYASDSDLVKNHKSKTWSWFFEVDRAVSFAMVQYTLTLWLEIPILLAEQPTASRALGIGLSNKTPSPAWPSETGLQALGMWLSTEARSPAPPFWEISGRLTSICFQKIHP